MTKRSLRTLYRHAKAGDVLAQIELDNIKKDYLDKFTQRYESISTLLEYRNLTLFEAHLLYISGIKVAAMSPHHDTDTPASERNYKTRMIRSYTNKHTACPCCTRDMPSNHMVWYHKDGFIRQGFLKICRACKDKYDRGGQGQCIAVYYAAFMSMCADGKRELGMQVYKVYLDRGLVFDRTSASKQGMANYAMRQVINAPDDMAARDKDMAKYEEENCSW